MDGNVSAKADCIDDVHGEEKMPEKMEGSADVRIEEMTPEKMGSCLLVSSSASACISLSAATTTSFEAKEGRGHVGRGRRTGQGAFPEPSRKGLERSLAFKRWARGWCFPCLERGH
jgi:hypothetical protein